MERVFVLFAALFGFLGVAAGAFGSHVLKERMSADLLQIFETAVQYQVYHALALLGVAWWITRCPSQTAVWSGWLFIAGVLIFSGSLYLLTLTDTRWLGAITPIGGTALLIGWICLAIAAWRS